MASNAKEADLAPIPGDIPACEETEPPAAEQSKNSTEEELSTSEMATSNRKGPIAHNGETSPTRLLHIAPGSARKTGRPVGKEFSEHLLAQMTEKGPEAEDLARKVLQLDEDKGKDDKAKRDDEIKTPAENQTVCSDDQSSKADESLNGTAPSAEGKVPTVGKEISNNEDDPIEDSSNNGSGPPKLFLATDSDLSTEENLEAVKSTSAGTVRIGKSSKDDLGTDAASEMGSVQRRDNEEAPSLTPMVDPRLASLRASESESGTSQSENEGGEEPQERKRRRGMRKRKKNGPRDEQVLKDVSVVEDNAEKGVDTAVSCNNTNEDEQVECVQACSKKADHGSPPVSSIREISKEANGEKENESRKEGSSKDVPEVTPSVEGENVDSQDNKSDSSETKKVTEAKASDDIQHSQMITESSKDVPSPLLPVPVVPFQKSRPRRTIKHKFLESPEAYDQDSSSGGQLRGRGRGGRSRLSGIVVRRRGGRSRGRGGSRGRGSRGGRGKRGASRGGAAGRMSTRGKGRSRWTHQKARKIYPMAQVISEPLVTIPAQIAEEASQDPQTSKPPIKVPKRGGYRGSRRRGTRARGGYKNVADRTTLSPSKTDTLVPAEVENTDINSAVIPSVALEKAKSLPSEETQSLVEVPQEDNHSKDSLTISAEEANQDLDSSQPPVKVPKRGGFRGSRRRKRGTKGRGGCRNGANRTNVSSPSTNTPIPSEVGLAVVDSTTSGVENTKSVLSEETKSVGQTIQADSNQPNNFMTIPAEVSQDTQLSHPPLKVPKRGGFRGSRRRKRGTKGRGGYRNVANRTSVLPPTTDTSVPLEMGMAGTDMGNSAVIPPVVSETTKSMPSEETESPAETIQADGSHSNDSMTIGMEDSQETLLSQLPVKVPKRGGFRGSRRRKRGTRGRGGYKNVACRTSVLSSTTNTPMPSEVELAVAAEDSSSNAAIPSVVSDENTESLPSEETGTLADALQEDSNHSNSSKNIEEQVSQEPQLSQLTVKVPKRGGFRGSRRRRGTKGRGGYRNVVNRTNVLPPTTDVPMSLGVQVALTDITSPGIPPVVSETTKSGLSEEGRTLSEPIQADGNPSGDSMTKDVPAPRLPEVRMELGKASEMVMPPPADGFAIPFASIRGKARKSQRSKNPTHFGQRKMKRKLKRKIAQSLGESEPSGGPPAVKRLQQENSTTSGTTAEDREIRTTHTGRMAPPSATPIKSAISRDHNYGISEPPLCCCKLVQDKPITAIADNCEAMEIVNGKVAACTSKVLEAKVMRPSSRIPFRGLCHRHKKRMKQHRCCPGCGCFCTTGLTMVCTIEGNFEHLFHRECIREINEALYCPHCGEDARLAKEVMLPDLPELKKLTIMPESVLLSHQRVRLPAAFLESLTGLDGLKLREALEGHSEKLAIPRAKMAGRVGSPKRTVSPVMPETPPQQDDNVFRLQLKTGRTLTSGMLPQGPSRESLEMAMKFMDPENPIRLRFAPKNLYMSSSLGEIEKVLQMLGEGFDPNYHFPAHNRETPVHAAAAKGHLDIVCMLVQAGANLDAEDEDHRTPLHSAVEGEKLECVKFLCRHGAKPGHKDDDGTAVVHMATMKGNKEILKYLISRKKVIINTQDNGGWTPIIWAADNKNADMVSFLLDHGADPNVRDKEQNIALHWAAYSGCEEVMDVLMNHCSFMEGLVNAVNLHGDTPLHVAARENNLGCVTQLLMRKADGKISNKEGDTPKDCAPPKSDVWLSIESNICINIYAQKRNLRTERILSRDICRGRENVPIPVINSIDDAPLPNNFLYVADNCETSRLDIDRNVKHMQGCNCDDDCSTEKCPCGLSSVRCWYGPDGSLAEDFNYQEPPLLFECGIACHCWTTCRNRVVQNGIKAHLQLFRTARMGWGLRTTHNIPKGSFICQYAGELISDAEADKREDDSYLFDLENREGDVYCIDARFYGNISRFINHLCDPNIVPVRVFIEHWDLRFPHIAFFTSREVKAFEELGFDYGDKFWSIKSKYFTCNCASKLCKHAKAPEPLDAVAKEPDN